MSRNFTLNSITIKLGVLVLNVAQASLPVTRFAMIEQPPLENRTILWNWLFPGKDIAT